MTVTIRGGGGATSNCTNDETDAKFVTKGQNESHGFGFDSRGSGSCALERSYSYFKVTVKDAGGTAVGYGDMWFGQNGLYGPYVVNCGPTGGWTGVNCAVSGDQTLKITAALKRRNLRDRNVDANAWFSIGAGYKVDIIGGGGNTSECTKDETVGSFTTNGDNERHSYQFIARDAGSCFFEFSWSNFRVEVRDPKEGGRVIGTGIMWLGQLDPIIGYRASCESGPPKWSPQTGPGARPYTWDRLKCTQTGSYDVKITRP